MSAASADITALVKDLRGAAENAPKVAHQLLADTAQKVQALGAAKAPRKTGTLANSIQVRWEGDLVAVVGPSVDYGTYQEFGTGERGEFPGKAYDIAPKTPGGLLVFTVNGRTVFARKVRHPGVKAQPFMRPAAVEALEPFTEKLADAGALWITKGPKAR